MTEETNATPAAPVANPQPTANTPATPPTAPPVAPANSATTNTAAKYAKVEEFLGNMIGLGEIKDAIKRFVALKDFQEKTGGIYKITDPNLNMCFRGSAGTGKTMIANRIADLYTELGFLGGSKENPLKVTAVNGASLLINGSSAKVHKIVSDAVPGILLIDEAYSLTESGSTVGDEIIAALLTEMEEHHADLAIILAGYTQKMYKFMNFNPGLRSRMGVNLTFSDYTAEELFQIMRQMLGKSGFLLTRDAENKIMTILYTAVRRPDFGNARFARQFVEEILFEHAMQTANTTDELKLKMIDGQDVTERIMDLLKLSSTGLM